MLLKVAFQNLAVLFRFNSQLCFGMAKTLAFLMPPSDGIRKGCSRHFNLLKTFSNEYDRKCGKEQGRQAAEEDKMRPADNRHV
jgi:hypothetical protein